MLYIEALHERVLYSVRNILKHYEVDYSYEINVKLIAKAIEYCATFWHRDVTKWTKKISSLYKLIMNTFHNIIKVLRGDYWTRLDENQLS